MSDELPGKPLAPHNAEAERTVLGAVLSDNETMGAVAEILTPRHFYDQRNRSIFESMLSLYERSEPMDLVSVKAELGESEMARIGGAYLVGLLDGLPRITNPEHWVRLIQREANRRACINLGQKFVAAAWDETAEPGELIEGHILALHKVSELSNGLGVQSIQAVVPEAIRQLDDYVSSHGGITGIPTGLPDLDKLTRGIQVGLWVIAARPSRGKSALAGQIAVHAASKGYRVLLFAMEMPAVDVVERMILGEAAVDPWALRQDSTGQRMAKVIMAGTKLSKLPIRFDSHEMPRLAHVKAVSRQQKSKGLDLIIVDHLQRMTTEKTDEGNWLAVGNNVQGLKSLSMALKVPVIATCQLTGDAEDKRRPTMADLAQARQIISAEADLVAMLHPEHPDQWRAQEWPVMNLYVDKQRKGPMGEIQLSFERAKSRFVCLAKQEGR